MTLKDATLVPFSVANGASYYNLLRRHYFKEI